MLTRCSEVGEKTEHFYDEAKAAADKVGEFISKEAEELEDRAKEARKRYVEYAPNDLHYHQSVCQLPLRSEEVPRRLGRLLEQP